MTAVWFTWTATSASKAVTVIGPPVNTALPVISGTVALDNTLTADPGTWDNLPTGYTGYKYQWQQCNPADNNCSDISKDATAPTYLIASKPNWTFKVIVTATNTSGSASVTSLPTP